MLMPCRLALGYSHSSDDKERYLKMAMKIDCNDSKVLERNQDNNDFLMADLRLNS